MNYQSQAIKDRILEVYGEPKDLDDLARCCITMAGTYDNALQPRDRRRKRVPYTPIKIAGFAWEIGYGLVSHYHEHPLNGKSYYAPDTPDGYMGWKGRVWIRYGSNCNGFMSDPMNLTLTYTGTGGAGAYGGPWERIAQVEYDNRVKHYGLDIPHPVIASWDYRFFADDWPLIQHDFEKAVAWAELSNGTQPKLTHKFTWTDPEFVEQDAKNFKDYEYAKLIAKDRTLHV